MEENKKSGDGDVRAEALAWDDERDKAKNVFFGFFPLAPTVARGARHSHPSPPEKSRSAEKKLRLWGIEGDSVANGMGYACGM